MIYFTSDLHFYHDNIIKHVGRPFCNSDEMNHVLIQNWNRRIQDRDEVYILGDVTMKGPSHACAVLAQLQWKKVPGQRKPCGCKWYGSGQCGRDIAFF